MFRAYDSARERLVAVKLFKLDLPPERGHQLVAEFDGLIALHLEHPALTSPLATGISGVSPFLVQDYVAADSLDLAVREHGAAPAGSALRVAAQLAGALDAAAAAGVTHGALHPRDVLLSPDDARLTGVGVTRALERIGVVAPVRRPYTAPERIAGGAWDRRADVFSLAVLIHELMWGRRVSGLGAQAADGLPGVSGGDPAALRAVFARALAEQPDDRFQTALEFADALARACPDVVVASAPAPGPKRRAAVRELELRLPLDGDESPVAESFGPAEPPVAPSFSPAESVAPSVSPADRPASAAARVRDADVVPPVEPPIAEPEIVPGAAPRPDSEEAPVGPPTRIPAGLITGHDPEPLSVLEQTRSAVWPLLLALGVGVALGFAGGYTFGSREQPVAAAPATPGREFTEGAVAPPPAASPNPEPRTQNSEPGNLKSETRNLKSPDAEGRVLVRTRPAGALVTVDGRGYGRTPATVRDLARGAHRMTIARDGYVTEERRVVITASKPELSLTVTLARPRAATTRVPAPAPPAGRTTGSLAVDSRPAGARVYVDGTLVGTTPVSLPSVAAGEHAIRLEHDGYRHWSSSVRVAASEQHRVTASLER